LPEARAKRKMVLKVKNFKEMVWRGSNGGALKVCNTKAKFHVGITELRLGVSLAKLAQSKERDLSSTKSACETRKVLTIAVL